MEKTLATVLKAVKSVATYRHGVYLAVALLAIGAYFDPFTTAYAGVSGFLLGAKFGFQDNQED